MSKKDPSLFDTFFRDSEGNVVTGQAPNAPIACYCFATLISRKAPDGPLKSAARMVAFGSILYWSWLELFEGVNLFRRGLGLTTMVYAVGKRIKNKRI